MASRSIHRARVPNDARGIALVVALLVMGLLTLLGATYLTIASTEHTIALNEIGAAKSFNIAEAGLERTKTRMKTGTDPLTDYLNGTVGPNLYSNVAFDGGTYTVVIEDDNDDANQTTDINNRVFIRATGTFGTARKQVLSLVEVVTGGGPGTIPGTRAAAESLSGGSIEIHGEPGSYDGRNWTPPALAAMASCTTVSTCGTLPNPNAAVTYGAFANKAASFSLLNGGTMFGTGCLPPSTCTSAATASKWTSTSPHTYWDAFITAAKAVADRTVGEATVGGAAGTLNWGTAVAPEVTVITDSGIGSIPWAKTVNGAGVLIIDSTSNETGTAFASTGQLNWQGLVIFRAPGEIQFDSGTSGKVRVFGQLVVASNTVAAQIELHNPAATGSFVKYSAAALAMAQQAVGGGAPSLTVRNWREVAMQ